MSFDEVTENERSKRVGSLKFELLILLFLFVVSFEDSPVVVTMIALLQEF